MTIPKPIRSFSVFFTQYTKIVSYPESIDGNNLKLSSEWNDSCSSRLLESGTACLN